MVSALSARPTNCSADIARARNALCARLDRIVVALRADDHVLQRRHAREQADVLESAAQAMPGPFVRRLLA